MDSKEDNSTLVNKDGSWNKDGVEMEIANKFTNANLFIKQDVFDKIKECDAPLRITDCFLDYIFHDVFPKKAVTTLDMELFVDFLLDYFVGG